MGSIDAGGGASTEARAAAGAPGRPSGSAVSEGRWSPGQKFRRELPIRDTRGALMTTSQLSTPGVLEEVMKAMIRKATEVLNSTAGLYREMTVSALRLVPRRN